MLELQEHGSLNIQWLINHGINPDNVLDFSVNINPYPVSPKVLETIRAVDPSNYPDPSAYQLRSLLASKNQVDLDQVIVGNGAAELIWLIAHALWRNKKVLIVSPTFGEYEKAAKAVNAKIYKWAAKPETFSIDLDAINRVIKEINPHFVVLCNPNNPTGYWIKDLEIREIAHDNSHVSFLIDESYRSFVIESPFSTFAASNTIHLRSMTKDFALAGLRIGYLLANPQVNQKILSIQPPWTVNSAAQAAALAAIEDLSYTQNTIFQLKNEALLFKNQLLEIGARVIPSATHYFLINVFPHGAETLWKELLLKGIHVRNCTSFGLPHYIRVSTRLPNQNERFIKIWSEIDRELSN